mgnify:FL=1
MNILFLTISRINDLEVHGIYTDLIREFIRNGHIMYIVFPSERRFHQPTGIMESGGAKILKVKTLNIQKTNIVEKGIGTLLLESQYLYAINKYWRDVKFDLILYSTPPITFNKVIQTLKKRWNAKTYLMLKDIFPQNAVDLGMFSKKNFLYRMFRSKEEKLYELSDFIGCMSPANCEYVLEHNPAVDAAKVEICPNSVELQEKLRGDKERSKLLKELNIPSSKRIFIYGGNLGKPQGIDFLLKVIEKNEKRNDSYFVIIGSGTEYIRVRLWFDTRLPQNACLLDALPKAKYDELVSLCDVGLIFLDKRFTIPNFPSRLLSYLENKMPVLMATDVNTDIGRIAKENGFGLCTESGNIYTFMELVEFMAEDEKRMKEMGEKGYRFLCNNYTVDKSYKAVMKHF